MPDAILTPGQSFFNLPVEGMEQVIALNLHGTLLPSQVFGEAMAQARRETEGILLVERAGELLFRIETPLRTNELA
jgi:hypothetical protein